MGWNADTTNCRTFGELPELAQIYLEKIERACRTPIRFVGVGPARRETIQVTGVVDATGA